MDDTDCWCRSCNEKLEGCLDMDLSVIIRQQTWSFEYKHPKSNCSMSLQQSHSRGRCENELAAFLAVIFTTPLFISTDALSQSDSKVSLRASFIAISCYFFQTVIFWLLCWFVGLEASSGLVLFPPHVWSCWNWIKILNFFPLVRVVLFTQNKKIQMLHQKIVLSLSATTWTHKFLAATLCSELSVSLSNSLNYAIWHKAHSTELKASISLSPSPN